MSSEKKGERLSSPLWFELKILTTSIPVMISEDGFCRLWLLRFSTSDTGYRKELL